MLMRWNNHGFGGFAPGFWAVNDLHREFGRLFQSFDDNPASAAPELRAFVGTEPKLKVQDAGDELRVYAELPGFRAEDIQVSFEHGSANLRGSHGSLVIRAQRVNSAPPGYVAQRTERGDLSFARTLTLPSRIDSDKIEAQLKNGILELRLPKQVETRARSIAVKSV